MDKRRLLILEAALLAAFIGLAATLWLTHKSDAEKRVDSCVSILGEAARDRCEQTEADR